MVKLRPGFTCFINSIIRINRNIIIEMQVLMYFLKSGLISQYILLNGILLRPDKRRMPKYLCCSSTEITTCELPF